MARWMLKIRDLNPGEIAIRKFVDIPTDEYGWLLEKLLPQLENLTADAWAIEVELKIEMLCVVSSDAAEKGEKK